MLKHGHCQCPLILELLAIGVCLTNCCFIASRAEGLERQLMKRKASAYPESDSNLADLAEHEAAKACADGDVPVTVESWPQRLWHALSKHGLIEDVKARLRQGLWLIMISAGLVVQSLQLQKRFFISPREMMIMWRKGLETRSASRGVLT